MKISALLVVACLSCASTHDVVRKGDETIACLIQVISDHPVQSDRSILGEWWDWIVDLGKCFR